jgi:N-acetylmuramoyl-L-alanine amidase
MRLVFETYTDSVQTVEEIGQNELKISFKKEKSSSEENKLENINYTIFIDPGHGGSDPGAIYGDIKEKDINLKVSLKLAEKLKQKGYNVILTRSDDSNISLDDRVKIVNTSINLNNNLATSSLLISIHSNAAFSTDVRGIEICYANDLSEGLVNILFSVFNSGNFLIRRSIKGKFYVLSRVSIPSVIIEMGFLTNDEDRKLLLNDEYQDKLIEKIIEAIELYRKGEVKNE